jgi:hypothetical protein
LDHSSRVYIADSAAAQSGDAVSRAQAPIGRRSERPVIYLDTSFALAHILAEDQSPPEKLWRETLISSRLLDYEVWTRIHGRNLTRSHSDEARAVLNRIAFVAKLGTQGG